MRPLVLALLISSTPPLPTARLPSSGGGSHSLSEEVKSHAWTVVLFFSSECPVQRAHDSRMLELVKDFGPRGVSFLAVDSQADANLVRAGKAVSERGYPFPIVSDPEGTWADALDARFSTTLVVLDREGRVRYHGGIDDERVKVSNHATPLARRALEQLLAGKEPELRETKAMGCVLRRR